MPKRNNKNSNGDLLPSGQQQKVGVVLDDDLRAMLKQFVNEVIKYNQKQSEYIDQFIKKKLRTGKNIFHFPFFLKEEHVSKFEACIKRRISEKYGEDVLLSFWAQAEFKNNDKLVYHSKEELFNATHDDPIIRIILNWTYRVAEEIENFAVEVPYDIQIRYEVEQDSDQKEMYRIEEFGGIIVENSEPDWINQTVHELRLIVNESKMPFWWYYPKMAYIAIREYVNYIFYTVGFLIASLICTSILHQDSVSPEEFILETREMLDAAQKIQAFIEYSLIGSSEVNLWIYVALITLLGGTIGLFLSKIGRYLFPQSMIFIGNLKSKLKNKLIAYNFVGSAVLTAMITGIGILIKLFFTL